MRSKTSLIQTIGRAARNANGRVILYADKKTDSINYAMQETERRRKKQTEYNIKHNITPTTIKKDIIKVVEKKKDTENYNHLSTKEINNLIQSTRKKMLQAAENFEFEEAIKYRTELKQLESIMLEN